MALVLLFLVLGLSPQVATPFPTPQIQAQNQSTGTSDYNPPPWWDDAGIATWMLVVVGIVASIIAICTLYDLRKQTAATKESADAAYMNAKAVINAERAWVVMNMEWPPGHSKLSPTFRNGINVSNGIVVRLIYSNQGKSIARINEILACFQIMEFIPTEPDLTTLRIIKANPEWVESAGHRLMEESFIDDRPQSGEHATLAVAWGIVRYSDAFGNHESYFGFSISSVTNKIERLSAPAKYNDLT